MFDTIIEGFNKVKEKFLAKGRLTEKNIQDALKEIRIALLQADVNYKVAKDFTQKVLDKAIGTEKLPRVSASQQFIKIFYDELVALLGTSQEIEWRSPTIFMLVGLQGSGKTTACVKLANIFRKKFSRKTLLIAADLVRPAAIDQLVTLGTKNNFLVYSDKKATKSLKVIQDGINYAKAEKLDTIIIDTQGRLHIDEALMNELKEIEEKVKPHYIYFICDATIGQDALTTIKTFANYIRLDGAILTKTDSDAKGGAAISIKATTGTPIKFLSTGEKIEDFEVFHPERFAERILGMGDVIGLVEQVQEMVSQEEAEKLYKKTLQRELDFNDMLNQLKMVKRMGKLSNILSKIPFLGGASLGATFDDDAMLAMKRMEAIILSMTPEERRNPLIIGESRRRRIAKGCGVNSYEVKKFIDNFLKTRKALSSTLDKFTKGNFDMNSLGDLFGKKLR